MNRKNVPFAITIIVILFFHASLCLNVNNITCNNCKLQPSIETQRKLNETFHEGMAFLYLQLNFKNITFATREFAYLTDSQYVIDPLLWVVAIGQNGRAMLQSPFDFVHLSLRTLSAFGINQLTIDIESDDCFMNILSDSEKLCAILDMIDNLIVDATNYLNEKAGEDILELAKVNVCLEKMSKNHSFIPTSENRTESLLNIMSTSAHTVLQLTSEYDCVPVADNIRTAVVISRHRALAMLTWLLYTLITFAVLFCPHVFFIFFQWQNPPKDGKIRLDSRPFPFGLFHFMFYSNILKSNCVSQSCSLSCTIRHIVFFFVMALLCCVQFLPYAYVNPVNYDLRRMAAERTGVLKLDWTTYALEFWAIAAILINIISYQIIKCYVTLRRQENLNSKLSQIGQSYITSELLFTLESDKDIVEIICPKNTSDMFEYDIRDTWNLKDVMKKLYNGNRTTDVKVLLTPVIVLYWFGQTIPLVYYSNAVTALIVSLIHNKLSLKRKSVPNGKYNELEQGDHQDQAVSTDEQDRGDQTNQTAEDAVLLYLKLLPFWLSFFFVTAPVFFQLFKTCAVFTDIFIYTFTGMILNAKYIITELLLVTGVAFFIVQTVTGYQNAYVELFYKIIRISESIGSYAISYDADGVPQIELVFFYYIAYKFKPWKKELFLLYVQLTSALTFFVLGYWLLQFVYSLHNLEGASQLIGAVIIGGFLPIIKLLTEPPATAKCKSKAERRQLQRLIMQFDHLDQTERNPKLKDGDALVKYAEEPDKPTSLVETETPV